MGDIVAGVDGCKGGWLCLTRRPDDLAAVSRVMAPSPNSVIAADHAIRDLIPALRENRPYLVTHARKRAEIGARFQRLQEAMHAPAELPLSHATPRKAS